MEELCDLEEAWLAGNDSSVTGRMTRSVAGIIFDMYCREDEEKARKLDSATQF